VKPGWRLESLGNLCRIELGGTPARKFPQYWDVDRNTDNVWVSIADLSAIDGKLICDSKEYLSEEGARKVKTVPTGTLLMSFKLSW